MYWLKKKTNFSIFYTKDLDKLDCKNYTIEEQSSLTAIILRETQYPSALNIPMNLFSFSTAHELIAANKSS